MESTTGFARGVIPIFASGSSRFDVTIIDYAFQPLHINITTGTTVVWTYVTSGSDVHTVTSRNNTQAGPVFNSGTIHPGQTFTYTFYQPGYYPYFCGFHLTIRLMNSAWANVTGPAITPPSTNQPRSSNESLFIIAGFGTAVVVVAAIAGIMVRRRKRKMLASKDLSSIKLT